MQISIFSLLKKYLRQYGIFMLLFFLFSGIFLFVFFLYGIELEIFLYAFILCFSISFIIVCVHFSHYYKKYHTLMEIKANLPLLPEQLPTSHNEMELLYQSLLLQLQDIRTMELTKYKTQKQDMIDYYSTWIHQIKIPISVMRLILQLEDTKEHQELSLELFRIEQYVEMVLSYFRLDGSSSDFIFKKHDLDDIIRQSIRKYAPSFIRKRLHLEYAGTKEIVLTDEKWLSFILEQLLSNAIKYTEQGSVRIFVDGNQILSISDTGIGIAKEDLPRIFEKGFTGYNGHAHKKSTGIGLYLCKKAADKLSCPIWVTSTVGKGTTVFIDLHKNTHVVE